MNVLLINKENLKNNVELIKQIGNESNTKLIAVVKGNGYGIGIVEYTKFLIENGMDFFAVASVEEAITLRNAGIENEILMLTPIAIKEDLEILIENNITLTVDSEKISRLIEEICESKSKDIKVHIKIDTGFGRHGFLYNDTETMINVIKRINKIRIEGIYSHFSTSLAKSRKYVDIQYKRFIDVINNLEKNNINFKFKHICNSTAFLKYPDLRLNTARIGSAFLGMTGNSNDKFKTVSKLKTKVIAVKELPKGFEIGYGRTYKTNKNTKIAIIPVGYQDGLGMTIKDQRFKFLSKLKKVINNILGICNTDFEKVAIRDRKYNVIGQIGMCSSIIDVTGTDIQEGEDVYIHIRPLFVNSNIERKII